MKACFFDGCGSFCYSPVAFALIYKDHAEYPPCIRAQCPPGHSAHSTEFAPSFVMLGRAHKGAMETTGQQA